MNLYNLRFDKTNTQISRHMRMYCSSISDKIRDFILKIIKKYPYSVDINLKFNYNSQRTIEITQHLQHIYNY